MTALKYWLWLTTRRGLDTRDALTLLDHFVTPERIYYADAEEYEWLDLRPNRRQALQDKNLEIPEKILGDCERLGLHIMTIQDADYPQRLRQLSDPPLVLYIKGRMFHFDEEAAIAVVGARQATPYGEKYAEQFGMELTAGGALVISGMAEGLDSCAIRGALKAGGPVVSVMAGGLDIPFPPRNRYLMEDVAAVGALISEYPPGTPHLGYHFPRRNRVLSGLALGVLAVECRPFGGTMSTVNHALDQDRDVFAIPGALDAPMSQGTNLLIQQGAKLVTKGTDILEEYQDRFPVKLSRANSMSDEAARARLEDAQQERERRAAPKQKESAPPPEPDVPQRRKISRAEQKEQLTDDELAILSGLGSKTRTADELVELTQIPTRRVLSAMTMLQVQGLVEEKAGRRFASLVELEE